MKNQVLFSLKNNEKIFMNVVCCSGDWHFKGQKKKKVHASNAKNRKQTVQIQMSGGSL